MLLRYALRLETEARAVELAIEKALAGGARTADLADPSQRPIGTREMAMAVESALLAQAPTSVN